jgi:hypothetical protein
VITREIVFGKHCRSLLVLLKSKKYFQILKAADLSEYKEVNCIDPSSSVKIPCDNANSEGGA